VLTKSINNTKRTDEQLAVIRQLRASLDPFFRIRVMIPARFIQAFLVVAEKEGESVTYYAKQADIPVTTMSRNLIDMSVLDRHYDDGPGLVDSKDNPTNRREKQYFLTPKGRALLASITKGGK
jgi:DNA-binding MarR family transcriptional regulator